MRYLFITSVWLLIGTQLFAQGETYFANEATQLFPNSKTVRVNRNNVINYVEFNDSERPSINSILDLVKKEYELSNDYSFVKRRELIDAIGITHTEYILHFRNIPIVLSSLKIHSKEDRVISFNGTIANYKIANRFAISEESALTYALDDVSADTYKWEMLNEELALKNEEGNPLATYYPKGTLVYLNKNLEETGDLVLCYQFNVYAHIPMGRWDYYINAENGNLEFVENLIHTSDVPAVAVTAYSDTVNMTTDSIAANLFRLRESGRGNGIFTFDMNSGTNYANAVDFIDSNNYWNTFSPAINRYATDAHWGTEKTYDYFFLVHGRNSIDNNGFALRSYVHYDNNYVNAFWNGTRMTYGDGNSLNSPLTTLDICGHEVTHGLTDFTSDLIYANESGALNESFSDIFGVAIENYARPNNWNWLLGEDIGGAFRSLSNPKSYNDPDTYGGVNWIDQNCVPTSANDQCGVHTNSGVQNYWFYLLTTGGTGVNDKGDTFNITAQGMTKAAAIAFRNNTVYLGRSSNHKDARFFAIRSAIDLYGACSPEVEATTNAWYAVGVGSEYKPFVSADFVATRDTAYCTAPAVVQFDSDGSNTISFAWNFGDNSPISNLADPVHTYSNSGTYTVTLITNGGTCGNDTVVKQNYISVDTANVCSYFLDGTTLTSTECNGTFYDAGGLNGNYPLDQLDTFIINPTSADYILLRFLAFDLEAGDLSLCNRDYLEVYDGSVLDPLIGRYCGNSLPPDTIQSTSNLMTLVFRSDQIKSFQGFQGVWECKNATTIPTASFTIIDDTLCTPFAQFYENSSGVIDSWFWDFGDNNTSAERAPRHVYQQDGTYDVSLVVTNSLGSDTLTLQNAITVQALSLPTTVSDTACMGGDLTLTVTANNSIAWYNDSLAARRVHQGSTLNLNNVQNTRNYFVRQELSFNAIVGSPFTIAGNGGFSSQSEAMYFDVHETSMLESVILNSNRAGNRIIELRDSNQKVIQRKELYVPSSASQVLLEMIIPKGNNYSLSIGDRSPDLYVNTTGATYPYVIGNYMTLTGNSIDSNAYPFFYFWKVKPLSCFSRFAPISAFIDTTCVIVGNSENSNEFSQLAIYPNPARNQFVIANLDQYDLNEVRLLSAEGKVVRTWLNENLNQNRFNISGLPEGLYFIQLLGTDKIESRKLIIND